ncbi:hypothetical protein BX600DRAFT_431022 [Xylariales sp. PMI_506]|nr:hypothetical protein BX600DRAFT_431022 [Xylariales sp. PMI_506]
MGDTLPSSRAILTSLINAVASHLPAPAPAPAPQQQAAARDLSSRLPPASRAQLTTLHVLYPSLLLPALDLLDRGLVTRVLVLADELVPALDEAEQAMVDAGAGAFHLVRSARPPQRRGRRSAAAAAADSTSSALGAGGGEGDAGHRTYVVRTQSWSCDCAAFAFAAFPAASADQGRGDQEQESRGYHIFAGQDEGTGGVVFNEADNAGDDHATFSSPPRSRSGPAYRWEFGGLSSDGRPKPGRGYATGEENMAVPCCKHLLACVLAERWSAVLGDYVHERSVGREEAAGLIASL